MHSHCDQQNCQSHQNLQNYQTGNLKKIQPEQLSTPPSELSLFPASEWGLADCKTNYWFKFDLRNEKRLKRSN